MEFRQVCFARQKSSGRLAPDAVLRTLGKATGVGDRCVRPATHSSVLDTDATMDLGSTQVTTDAYRTSVKVQGARGLRIW